MNTQTDTRTSTSKTVTQGDIYWIEVTKAAATELGQHPHPYVIIQDNLFNHSRLDRVIVCAITTNIGRASWAGNVRLEKGEANLPKQSVIEVSKVSSVVKTDLGEYIGRLSQERIAQILAGMRFQQSVALGR